MKTIFVIYTNVKITDKKDLRVRKKYCFNTKDEIAVGDMLSSNSYDTKMQVTQVLDNSYKYYNSQTGELANTITSTAHNEIAEIVLGTNDSNTVYAVKE